MSAALAQAWKDANAKWVTTAYTHAAQIVDGGINKDVDRYLTKLYGEDHTKWDRTEGSRRWLENRFAKNPYVAATTVELEAGEKIVSTLRSIGEDGEMCTTSLTVINGEDVVPVAIDWWWPDRFALGKISWLAGLPGTGKTTVMFDAAARITTGRDFPDKAKNTLGPHRALIAMSEDGLGDTVVPRLKAAGADMTKISFLNRVVGNSENALLT